MKTLLLLFCSLIQLGSAATYYVSPTGSNAAAGTIGAPFLTVQYAVTTAAAGDTVMLGAGTYAENVNSARNGTSGSRITIDGQGVATLTKLNLSHEYHTIKNLTFSGTMFDTNTFHLYVGFGSHYMIVEGCTFDMGLVQYVDGIEWRLPSGGTGPYGTGTVASNCIVRQNLFKNAKGAHYVQVGGDDNLVTDNVMRDGAAIDYFYLFGRRNTISLNRCTNNYAFTGVSNHPDFVQTFGENGHGSIDHIVEKNYCRDSVSGAPWQLTKALCPDIGNWIIRYNLFMDMDISASSGIPGLTIHNNIFFRCNKLNAGHAISSGPRSYTTVQSYNGTAGTDYPHNGNLYNNVFLDIGVPGAGYNNAWYSFTTDLTGCSANYNYVGKDGYLPILASTTLQNPVGDPGGWELYRWWETNGINGGNPTFVDEEDPLGPDGVWFTADDGFRLASGSSILVGTGQSGADIGIYDFTEPFYVATTGSDAAAGTLAAPWLTIQKAANTLTAGQRVIVSAGDYPEHVTTTVAGTVDNRIAFTASGTVTMRGFSLNHAYTTISGFTIDKHSDVATTDNAAVSLGTNGDYAVVTNNTIKNTMYKVASDVVVGNTNPDTITSATGGFTAAGFRAGVKVWVHRTEGAATPVNGSLGFLVASVTDTVLTLDAGASVTAEGPISALLTGAKNYGLYSASGATNATVSGNTFSDFGWKPLLMQGTNHTIDDNIFEKINGWDCIGFNGTGHVISNNWIRDSLVMKAYYPSADVFAHWTPSDTSNITISGNFVQDWMGAINVDHLSTLGTNSTITYANNVFYGNIGPIIARMPNVTLRNNTFVNVSSAVTAVVAAVDHPFYFDITYGAVAGSVIKNNIFVGCGNQAASGASHGWYALQTGVTADYNLASGPSPGFATKTGFSETNGLNGGSPGFANIALPLGVDGLPFTADDGLRLAAGSQAIGAGEAAVDIGAYAYDASAAPEPSTPQAGWRKGKSLRAMSY